MWEMEAIRALAIEKIDKKPLDPVQKYLAAVEMKVDQWIVPALLEIAQRPEPLSMHDYEVLGIDCVLRLARVRESVPFRLSAGGAISGAVQRQCLVNHPRGLAQPRVMHLFGTQLCQVYKCQGCDHEESCFDNRRDVNNAQVRDSESIIRSVFELSPGADV